MGDRIGRGGGGGEREREKEREREREREREKKKKGMYDISMCKQMIILDMLTGWDFFSYSIWINDI